MITYAGIPVTPPSDADQLAAAYWHGHRVWEFNHQGYAAPSIGHLPIPAGPNSEPPRVGVLSWPTGASRWAACHLMITGAQLALVRTAVGATPSAKTLRLDDGNGGAVSPSMWMLPPRAISQRGDDKEYYLLTLVDDRWWWWQAGEASVNDFATWVELLTALFAAVGVVATITAPHADYLTPDVNRWSVNGPVPPVIDAACRQVGLRVVRRLDGSVHVVDYTAAAAADDVRWTAVRERVLAGGRFLGADLGRASPASVDVRFPDGPVGNVTLASLALSGYSGVNGAPDKKALIDADPTGASDGQRDALATRAAGDYYKWFLSLTDCTLRGLYAGDPTGLDDRVEWVHHPTALVTRLLRPEWSDRNVYGGPSATESCLRTDQLLGSYGAGPPVEKVWYTPTPFEFATLTLPCSGRYLLTGVIGFLAQPIINPTAFEFRWPILAARLYNFTLNEPIDGSLVIASFNNSDYIAHETRSFAVLYDQARAGDVIGYQIARHNPQGGTWAYATIGSQYLWLPATSQNQTATALSYVLICENECDSGSGVGSQDCTITGFEGAGWYCVLDGAECVPLELLEEDRCNAAIVICSGPYATEGEALLNCGESGSVTGDCCAGASAAEVYCILTVYESGGGDPLGSQGDLTDSGTEWAGAVNGDAGAGTVTLSCVEGVGWQASGTIADGTFGPISLAPSGSNLVGSGPVTGGTWAGRTALIQVNHPCPT